MANAVNAAVGFNSTNDPIVLNITGQAASIAVAGGPSHGTVSVSGTSVTYTPTSGYSGTDSFTYTATNAAGASSPATVTINVNPSTALPAPTAAQVSAAVAYGSTANPIVLNIAGVATYVTIVSLPANGTVSVSGTSVTYTPNVGFSGTDSFVYTASNGSGTSAQETATITVNPVSGPLTASQLSAWVAGLTDLANTMRVDTTYDFRGNVASVTSYGSDTGTGAGNTAATTEVSQTSYVYSPSGQLLQTLPAAAASAYAYEGTQRLTTDPSGATYTYDGLGRVLTSTSLTGATTSITYSAASTTTVVTLASGLTQTSTYNKLGELVSYTESGSGMTTATTTYTYDADGQLTGVTDPDGNSTYYLYDAAGRKVADIAANGALTEYVYTTGDQVAETIAYATPLTSAQLASLASASPTSPVTLASVLPTSGAADRYSWSIYDSAHRLIETIDGTGAVTIYAYDGASNLVSTTTFANRLQATTLASFQSAPPTSPVTPAASNGDQTTRYFYDAAGQLIGTLNGDGDLTETVYNDAGQKTQTIAFATAAAQSLWATGSFAQLLASVGTNNAAVGGDVHTWYVYDARGLLRGVVDGDGDVTQYHYTPLGQVDQTITGQQLSVSSLLTTAPTLATLTGLSTSGAGINITNYTYNLNGQVLTTTRSPMSGDHLHHHRHLRRQRRLNLHDRRQRQYDPLRL